MPKVVSCCGSDSIRYRQLVKGKDDLRQDAVMQQVFVLMNRLLAKDPATASRNLSIRTYKVFIEESSSGFVRSLPSLYILQVIPLSQTSGVVEWCEGTMTLAEYLIGWSGKLPCEGAHARHRPQDWAHSKCRTSFHVSYDLLFR